MRTKSIFVLSAIALSSCLALSTAFAKPQNYAGPTIRINNQTSFSLTGSAFQYYTDNTGHDTGHVGGLFPDGMLAPKTVFDFSPSIYNPNGLDISELGIYAIMSIGNRINPDSSCADENNIIDETSATGFSNKTITITAVNSTDPIYGDKVLHCSVTNGNQ